MLQLKDLKQWRKETPTGSGQVRGRWSVGRRTGDGEWEIPRVARDKWGLSQGRNSEIGEDEIRYTRERIARGYQVVKYFAENGED